MDHIIGNPVVIELLASGGKEQLDDDALEALTVKPPRPAPETVAA